MRCLEQKDHQRFPKCSQMTCHMAVQKNKQTCPISKKKSTWALEAAAGEAKGIGRPGTKSLDQKKVLFEFKSRSQRQIAIAKANSKKQLYFKEGQKQRREKKGSLTYINRLHTKGKIDSS